MKLLHGTLEDMTSSSYWGRFISSFATSVISRFLSGFRLSLTNINISVYMQLVGTNNNVPKSNYDRSGNKRERNSDSDDHAVLRLSIPAIDICPPSESTAPHHKVSLTDSISNLLSKNVDIRGLTISISRHETKKRNKKKNVINSIYSNINYGNTNTDDNTYYNSNYDDTNNWREQFQGYEESDKIPKASDFIYTIESPLTDVLLNPVHFGISAVVSALSQAGRVRTNSASTEKTAVSEHQLSLTVELGNVEFSPTVKQLHLLSDALSSLRLERVRARLSMFRPKGTLKGNARKWWRYAFHAIRELLSERHR